MLTFLLCTLIACQDKTDNGFSSSGTGINPNETGPTTGSDNPSTGGGSGDGGGVSSGNLEDADNEDAPQISGADAFFSDYEGIGDLIEVHVYYTDEQDDLEGGMMTLSYSNADTTGSETIDLTSDNASAKLEEGEVTALFANVDTDLDYQFVIRLVDAAGNYSNEFYAMAPASN